MKSSNQFNLIYLSEQIFCLFCCLFVVVSFLFGYSVEQLAYYEIYQSLNYCENLVQLPLVSCGIDGPLTSHQQQP